MSYLSYLHVIHFVIRFIKNKQTSIYSPRCTWDQWYFKQQASTTIVNKQQINEIHQRIKQGDFYLQSTHTLNPGEKKKRSESHFQKTSQRNCYPEASEALNYSKAADGACDKKRTSSVLCLGNPILPDATFERLRGEKVVWQRPWDLLNVEFVWGVRKCHFGVVVYSNVREKAPMRSRYAPPYLPPFRSHPPHPRPPFPSTYSLWARPAACHIWRSFLTTRNFFCVCSAQKHSQSANCLSVKVNSGFLLIVSRDSWSQIGASVLRWAFWHHQ